MNPATGARVPIWVADYVLGGYGSGAIMAVPAHDARDHRFAEQYGLPAVQVVQSPESREQPQLPFTGEGLPAPCLSTFILKQLFCRYAVCTWHS